MTFEGSGMAGYSARELILAAAARAVLTAFHDQREEGRVTATADATLYLLEAALEPYPPANADEPGK
jgi:hypothetical protein